MTDQGYETHSNEEPIRLCPYCDWEGASRGLTLHVLNTVDEDHGDKYDLPEDFDASDAEIVGTETVDVKMPEKYNIEHRQKYVCDYCGKICEGEGGLKTHLSRLEGDEVHHEGSADRDPDTFPTFKVSEDGKLISQDDESLALATGGAVGGEDSFSMEDDQPLMADLKQLRDTFMDRETIDGDVAGSMIEELISKHQ